MAFAIVKTLNRTDSPPLSPTLSHLSIVSVPCQNSVLHLLYTAGQVGTPPPTKPPTPFPSSFRDQAANALENIRAILALGGAAPWDVTSITIYVVNYEQSYRDVLIDLLPRFFAKPGSAKPHAPPSALLEVAGLAQKAFLVEISVTAAISASNADFKTENAENAENADSPDRGSSATQP